jgi:hypothetical protein
MIKLIVPCTLLYLFVLTGCVEQLNPKDFEAPPFPVAIGFISPQDDTLSIRLLMAPAFNAIIDSSGSNTLVTDAHVTITDIDQDKHISLPYQPATGRYEISADSLLILPGHRYKLDIQFGGQKITADCQVPSALDSIHINEIKSFNSNYLQASWKDPTPLNTDYFVISGRYFGLITYPIGWDDQCNPKARLITDLNQTAATLYSPLGSISNYGCNGSNGISPNDSAYIELVHADQSYFQYYNAVFSATAPGTFGDPVTIYTNIIGGQGVFAAYCKISKKIALQP